MTTNVPVYEPPRRRPGSIVVPTLLIILGAIFLAQNLGFLSWSLWLEIWRYWPVVLVLIGIELVLGRGSWLAAAIVVTLILLVAGTIGWMVVTGQNLSRPFGNAISAGVAVSAEHMSEVIGDARQATINLQHGAGTLEVSALPTESQQLFDGSLRHDSNTTIERNIQRTLDQVSIDLRSQRRAPGVPIGNVNLQDWQVQLSPNLPIDLRVRSGASELRLDLSKLKVSHLDLETGASAVNVVMPEAAGQTNARIKVGAASVDVTIPTSVAARIQTQGALSSTTIDEGRFPKVGDVFQSPDYDTAANRVDLEIDSGVAGVNVR